MKNWKTTIAGILAAAGLALSNSSTPALALAGKIAAALGAFLLGAVAKDHNVTGGNVQQ